MRERSEGSEETRGDESWKRGEERVFCLFDFIFSSVLISSFDLSVDLLPLSLYLFFKVYLFEIVKIV